MSRSQKSHHPIARAAGQGLANEAYRGLRQKAAERGHEGRTVGAGVGGFFGAMAGSFLGPLGALAGGALGGWIGAKVGEQEGR